MLSGSGLANLHSPIGGGHRAGARGIGKLPPPRKPPLSFPTVGPSHYYSGGRVVRRNPPGFPALPGVLRKLGLAPPRRVMPGGIRRHNVVIQARQRANPGYRRPRMI